MPNRGEVWLANLDPRRGTEPGKTRPVLLVQAQALMDAGHPSTLVVPLTTNLIDDAEPLRLRVPASQRLRRPSDLLIDQLRAIDNRRLVGGPLTRLPRPSSPESMKRFVKSSDFRSPRGAGHSMRGFQRGPSAEAVLR